MLFDLRSRRRRSVVRVIYLFLALVMVGGLLLVGVGTGSGGGILNAIGSGNNGGSTSGQSAYLTQQLKKAEAEVKANPHSASGLAALFKARFAIADSGSNVTADNTPTKSAIPALKKAAAAWVDYIKLSGTKPTEADAFTAARVYQDLADYSGEASAWEYAVAAVPAADKATASTPYICLTLASYAAGLKSQGTLAATKALKLAPKLDRITLKTKLNEAKTSTTDAKELVAANC